MNGPAPGDGRRLVLIVVLLLVALGGALAWRALRPAGGSGARTATVTRGTVKAAIDTSGKLVARRTSSVSSPASGQVRLVAVREGEAVRRGDVLAVLDDRPTRAEIDRAERAVEAAEARAGGARQRAQGDPALLPEVAAAEREADDARAALTAANERLAGTLLLAPFDGTVATVRVTEGAGYSAGTEAFTIADAADLVVSSDLDEVDRPLVSVGQEATLTVLAFPGTSLTGTVTTLSDIAQTRGGTTIFPLTIAFSRPTDLGLLPGMGVDIHLVTRAREAVLLLPSGAVRRAGERQYVVVRRDGRDHDAEIRTGARSGGVVEIVSGVDEGDIVVLP